MAYAIVHYLMFGVLTLGWLLCCLSISQSWVEVKRDSTKIFGKPFKATTFVGVWRSYVRLEYLKDKKPTTDEFHVFYDVKSYDTNLNIMWCCRFFTLFTVSVGFWAILGGLMDSLYFKGRSTVAVGLLGIVAVLFAPPTLVFFAIRWYDDLGLDLFFLVFIISVIMMGVSSVGLIIMPAPKPQGSDDTNIQEKED